MLECYNPGKKTVDRTWGRLPVILMTGGVCERNHYGGVGMVRYAAEKDAEIQQVLADEGVVDFLQVVKDFESTSR